MSANPRVKFWTDFVAQMHEEIGKQSAHSLLGSGRLIMNDIGNDYIKFLCLNANERNFFADELKDIMKNVVKKIRPTFHKIEIICARSNVSKVIELE